MKQAFRLVLFFVACIGLLIMEGCGQPKWNSDYNLSQARTKEGVASTAIASADSTAPIMESNNSLKDEVEKKDRNRKKKQNKRYFLGYKVKRGFIKTGRGSRETIETFSYLDKYEEPNPYAPLKYYYDSKKRVIHRSGSEEKEPGRYKVLHGPYEKRIDGKVVEEGYYYVGTKHLRWERYRKGDDGILIDKTHFEKGFLRDAKVTYFDSENKKIKEVLPYEYGEAQGTYYRFYENGQVEWIGQYEKGRKVGVWIKHYDFRGRRHYEYQYPESAYDKRFEPYLIKEYDRHGTLIFEKDKFDKRPQASQN
jgi:antitoxin component YwqK of YwqJK toxin-antitoxin module